MRYYISIDIFCNTFRIGHSIQFSKLSQCRGNNWNVWSSSSVCRIRATKEWIYYITSHIIGYWTHTHNSRQWLYPNPYVAIHLPPTIRFSFVLTPNYSVLSSSPRLLCWWWSVSCFSINLHMCTSLSSTVNISKFCPVLVPTGPIISSL